MASGRGAMMRRSKKGMELPYGRALQVGLLALVLGTLIVFPAQIGVATLPPYVSALVILLVVLVGVASDIVGVSATRARETPFIARASKRIPGAREGLYLVRHADAVATIMLDLVGDLCGTVSGALAAGIVLEVSRAKAIAFETAVVVGIVSGLTIGMKALAKSFAVRRAEGVIIAAGRILHGFGIHMTRL